MLLLLHLKNRLVLERPLDDVRLVRGSLDPLALLELRPELAEVLQLDEMPNVREGRLNDGRLADEGRGGDAGRHGDSCSAIGLVWIVSGDLDSIDGKAELKNWWRSSRKKKFGGANCLCSQVMASWEAVCDGIGMAALSYPSPTSRLPQQAHSALCIGTVHKYSIRTYKFLHYCPVSKSKHRLGLLNFGGRIYAHLAPLAADQTSFFPLCPSRVTCFVLSLAVTVCSLLSERPSYSLCFSVTM